MHDQEEILSFEASESGKYGDILSERPAETKPRIGLLGCGYFEYWRMFSPDFKQKVLGDLDRIADRLRERFEVVYPGVVDTLDAADAAGKAFAENKVDALVVVEGTYVPDFISLHAIDHVREVPAIMFTTQVGEDITPEDDYEALMRNSALIGTAQLSGTFRKMGRDYEVVVGSIEDDDAYRKIEKIVNVRHAVDKLRNLNVGVVGHVFRGMYDLENDKTRIKGTLGFNVIYVELSHLLKHWQEVSEEEGMAEARKMVSRFNLRGATEKDLYRSCRLGLAMERLIDHLRLDALCFLGQHYIEKETGAPARIGSSMIMEKDEHMVASEGDLAGLFVMQVMRWFSGNSPLQAEWGQYDASHNAVFLVGHGVASPSIAASDKAVTITRAPEEWGFEGAGANMEFIMKPGGVTLAHLLNTPQGWQMLVSPGESLEYPCLPCEEIHALVRVNKPVKEYLTEIQQIGVTHHVIVVHGDVCEELRMLCDILRIRCFIV